MSLTGSTQMASLSRDPMARGSLFHGPDAQASGAGCYALVTTTSRPHRTAAGRLNRVSTGPKSPLRLRDSCATMPRCERLPMRCERVGIASRPSLIVARRRH